MIDGKRFLQDQSNNNFNFRHQAHYSVVKVVDGNKLVLMIHQPSIAWLLGKSSKHIILIKC